MDNNNKPKKEIIGESTVVHVHKGFAIPVIIIFMTLLLIFSICWGGVLAADAICDNIVNPLMLKADPDAEPIDIMAVMNPPTSEQEAAKVYAEFPSLNLGKIANSMGKAFSSFPQGLNKAFWHIGDGISDAVSSFIDTVSNDPGQISSWFSAELGPTVANTVDAVGKNLSAFGGEIGPWLGDRLFPAVKESAGIASKTVETYPQGVERWYDDHLPFRSIIFNTNQKIDGYIEEPYDRVPVGVYYFHQGMLELMNKAPDTPPVQDPESPGGEDLEIPDDPDDPGDWDDPDDPDKPPEYPSDDPPKYPSDDTEDVTPPPFESGDEGNTETEDPSLDTGEPGETDDGQGGVAVCEHEANEGEIEKPATCTEWGVMKYSCVKCGETMYREYTAKVSHDYVTKDDVTPLCGETYTVTSSCSVCGDTKTKTAVKKHTKGSEIKTVTASYASYGYVLNRCKDCGGEYRTNLKNKLNDSGVFFPTYHNDTVMEGKDKWLFYLKDNSEAYYMGTNLMSDAELEKYVQVMTTLNDMCIERGITLQLCIWPNKDQVYPEFTGLTPVTQEKRADLLVKYVRANSDVKIIYPIEELKKAKPYYDMYFKYDTHWNNAGGFVGYQAMLKSLGLATTSINNSPVYTFTGGPGSGPNTDPYLGPIADMIGLGQLSASNYPGNFNYFVKYRPDVKATLLEGKNGAGDYRHTTAPDAPNDLNFVMLADSYRVMQLSYLEKDFTDCVLDHREHIKGTPDPKIVSAIRESDILVIAAVERFESDILTTAEIIIDILSQE